MSLFQKLSQLSLMAVMLIPLNPKSDWQELKYKSIASNKVKLAGKKLQITVNKSASPLIQKFNSDKKVVSVTVSGQRLSGSLNIPEGAQQGQTKKPKADDYLFRLGLVLEGKNKKPRIPGFLIPAWVKKMFKLAPEGKGIKHIYFLNVAEDKSSVGQKRPHPLEKKYLYEEVITSVGPEGRFKFTKSFKKPVSILGFWISSDGDDTKSQFSLEVDQISVTTQ